MRTLILNICFCSIPLFLAVACNQSGSSASKTQPMQFKKIPVTYPVSRQDSTVAGTYFATTINDPYRWLEDDQSAETNDWEQKQNAGTCAYL